jgi:hypothetical protein
MTAFFFVILLNAAVLHAKNKVAMPAKPHTYRNTPLESSADFKKAKSVPGKMNCQKLIALCQLKDLFLWFFLAERSPNSTILQ